MRRLLDLLLARSKATRRSRQKDRESARRDAEAVAEHRERQAHYREVTQSDALGRDTSVARKSPSERSERED